MMYPPDLCLPVLKYSHALGVQNNSISWSHIVAPDLSVILRSTHGLATHRNLIMQITQGTTMLEEVDIARYCDDVAALKRLSSSGAALRIEELPIFGIAKENLLAIRYRHDSDQPRRLQLRLSSSKDCRELVRVLEQRGVTFQDQRHRTSRPSSVLSQTNSILKEADGPKMHHVQMTEAHQSQHSVKQHPLYSNSHTVGSSQGREFGIGGQHTASRQTDAERHGVAHWPRSQADYQAKVVCDLATNTATHRPHETLNADSNDISVVPAQEIWFKRHESGLPELSILTPACNYRMNVGLNQHDSSNTHLAPAQDANIHHTSLSQIGEHQLPPRRELPFKRPRSHHDGSDGSSSRPGSSLALPPLRKPSISRDSSSASGPKQSSTHTVGRSTSQRNSSSVSDVQTQAANTTESRVDHSRSEAQFTHAGHASVSSAGLPTVAPANSSTILSGVDRSTNNGQDAGMQLSSLLDVPRHISPALATTEVPTGDMQTASATETSEPYSRLRHRASAMSTSPPSTDWLADQQDLARYAAQNLDDRMTAIDDFVVAHLRDPAFTTLCKDVENCWRRVALGL